MVGVIKMVFVMVNVYLKLFYVGFFFIVVIMKFDCLVIFNDYV